MANVVSITVAQKQKRQNTQVVHDDHRASALHSPVPNLIALLEPIIDSVKSNPTRDVEENVAEFLEVLEISRQEINQLEDMAKFLLTVNTAAL